MFRGPCPSVSCSDAADGDSFDFAKIAAFAKLKSWAKTRAKRHPPVRKACLATGILISALCVFGTSAQAATYYLDCAVASSGNGSSWATAWKNFSNISGLNPGDTVMISGGSTSQICTTGDYNSVSGTQASPITYQVSSDAGHNGTLTINATGAHFIYASAGQGIGQWNTWNGSVGGAIHLIINAGSTAVYNADSSKGIVLKYIQFNGGQLALWGSSNTEIAHILWIDQQSIHLSDGDAVQCPNGGAASYTTNLIHDSTFMLNQHRANDGLGTDGFKWCAHVSIYNNQILGVLYSGYSDGQHQDGTQSYDDYVALYNNYIENMQNYGIYGDPHDSGSTTVHHWRIYNNIINGFASSGASQGVAIGCENVQCDENDIIVANNTVVNEPQCITMGNDTIPPTFSGPVYVVNNLCYGTPLGHVTGVSGITTSNNTTGTSGISFVNPQTNAAGDWHLLSNSPSVIGQAISPSYLTSVYTADKDGNSRPSGAWDIGAYELGGGGSSLSPPTGLTASVQ